jgi:alpha-glucoside transport system substrate-binding protein
MSVAGRRRIALVVVIAASVFLLWQCTGAFDKGSDAEAITVFGPWLGDEADAFGAVLDDFTDETGIEVRYTGTNNFDTDLRARITSGNDLPDVAMVPQPALIAELVVLDLLVPLSEDTIAAIVENYGIDEANLAIEGEVLLAPYRTAVKSLVWYRPDVFLERGWQVPTTLDELHELTEEIAADDSAADPGAGGEAFAPWCFAIESGTSTGWAATDWIEEIVLRRGGPEFYDRWAAGEVDWDDETITDAIAEFEDLLLTPGNSYGGSRWVVSEAVAAASEPMFAEPPGCVMYRQATFATSWFPSDVEIEPDGELDFFVLPGVDAAEPAPLLRGGDGALKFSDRAEVDELMTFLVTPEGGAAWAERGGYLSGRTSVEPSYYAESDRRFAELLLEDRVERFDASDLMLSDLRDVWYEQITEFIASSSHLDVSPGLDRLTAAMNEEQAQIRRERDAVLDDS